MGVVRELAASRARLDIQDHKGFSPLHCAAQKGHMTVVEELCRQGAQVDITTPTGATPLFIGAQEGHTDAVNALLQGGASVDMDKDGGATPLFIAAHEGHTDTVNALIQGGANADQAMDVDATPLFIAARNGHLNVVSTLLHKKASVNFAMKAGHTPLTAAAFKGHAAIVRVLLTAGASQLVRYPWSVPLVQAVQRKDMPVVYALMDLGEVFSKSGSEDFTPLQWASLAEKDEVVEKLLDHDEATRKHHKPEWSHLHQVAESGGVKATRILIQRGAAVDARDADVHTPLHLAAAKDHGKVAQVLLDNGADINILDMNQETPLHVCARNNAASVSNALIQIGVDVSCVDSCISLIHICAKYDSVDVAILLMETNFDKESKRGEEEETALHICAKRDHSAVAELLLRNGANVEARDARSRTPLHICACSGNASMTELLIKCGCNVNPLDHSNNTPLHLCQDDSIAVAQYLLDHGADESARNNDMDTPLHNAVKLKQTKLLRFFVGISEGWTMAATDEFDALQWASASHNVRMVKMLLDNPKTDISHRDRFGRNALDIAVHTKNVAAAKALVGLDDTWKLPPMEGLAPVHWSAVANNVMLMNAYLSDPNTNANIQDSKGRTALHFTGVRNSLATAELLLNANACCRKLSNEGEPPLFTAYRKNSSDVFWLLVRHQFDVRDNEGNTILHIAAQSGDSKIMGRVLAECAGNTHFLLEALNNEGNSALHLAIREDHIDSISLLVQSGANCMARNGEGSNALDLAVLLKNTAAAKLLVGVDKTWIDPGMVGFTSLHWCAVANRVNLVKYYLDDAEINVDIQDTMGRTALHLTGTTDAFQVADLLLKNKASVELKGKDGFPPLFTANYYNSREVFSRLLSRKVGDVRDSDENTVLHLAAHSSDSKIMSRVLAECAGNTTFLVEATNNEGDSALHLAIKEDHIDAVSLLVQAGANCMVRNGEGSNALDLAVLHKNTAAAKLLVGLDNAWSAPGMVGFTTLHWCAVANRVELVKYYLDDAKINVDIQDTMGRTALHLTGTTDAFQAADLLLKNKASVEMKAKDGFPPLFTAYYYNSRHVFSRLLSRRFAVTGSDGDTIVHITARLDDSKSIYRLLTEDGPMLKVLVTKTNNKGDSALHVAASENSVNAATALLQAGADTSALNAEKKKPVDLVGEKWNMLYLLKEADIGIVTTGTLGAIHQRVADGDDTLTDIELIYTISSCSEGLSILHVAVINRRCAMVKRLLDLGVDVNVQDNNGRSPLHLATRQLQLNITRMLLQGDSCDVDITYTLGRSPLHWAARENNSMLVECLLKAGANASLQAEDYKTPVHLLLEYNIDNDVKKRENEESISLLLDHIHQKEGQEATVDLAASVVSSLIMSENHHFRTEKIRHVLSKVKGHTRFFSSPCYLSNQTKGLLKEVSERWSRYTVFMALVEYYPPKLLIQLLRLTTEETINSTNFLQQNALHLLAEKHVDGGGNGNVEKVSILTEHGLDPIKRDINGRTPLHLACQHQYIPLVRCMLESFSMPDCLGFLNSKDIMGRTALHHLIRNANESSQNEDWKELINQFISLGADPNVYDYMGDSALECGYDRQVDSIMALTGSLPMQFPQISGTKMGLLKVNTKNELPTSLGGNNVVNEPDINAWISSLRTKYASNSATDYFLKSTKFGHVGMTYTNRINAEKISRFVTEVCQTTLQIMHVEGHIELGGSMAEGTKVGPVDEMDFLLRLTDMEESVKVTSIECTCGSPFAKLSNSEGEFKSAEKALDVLEAFLQSLNNLSSLPGFGISLEDVKRNKLKVFTLVLKCAQRSGGDLLVTIDLVPCIIKEFGYHPSWEPSVRCVSGEGHNMKDCPLLMKKDGFEVSYSELEHNALREMDSYQRNAYMLLKVMRTEEICPRLTSMKIHESIDDIIPSYIFKMCLLWIVDPECKRTDYLDFVPEDLSELAENEKIRHLAIDVLSLISTKDAIQSYFCPSTPLRLTHNCRLLCQIMRGVLDD